MIISRAPYRISFFGGGTDYPEWYKEHGGVFLSSAIDHHINIILRQKPSLDNFRYRVVWRELENVETVDAIKHPFVRAALQKRKINTGLDVVYFGQLPHGAGIGSSSSFGVAFLTALNALEELQSTPYDLAQEVFEIEHDLLGETVGVQDQFTASFGGFNFGQIDTSGKVTLEKLNLPARRIKALNDRLFFVFSGVSRHASSIALSQVTNFPHKQTVLQRMQELAYMAKDILTSDQSLDDFGELLHESWMLKKSLSPKVSTDLVEDMYNKARSAGALGGKLLGAGGGGFMLFYVPENVKSAVSKALENYVYMPICLDAKGAEITMNSPQKYADYYDKIWSVASTQ